MYLIEIPHQTTTVLLLLLPLLSCILSKFHIKPQRVKPDYLNYQGCILSKFHIKPQHATMSGGSAGVVSYRNSTSNHNCRANRKQTTKLYLIEIPHQTTTRSNFLIILLLLYLIEIPHQTTTSTTGGRHPKGCILSKFHIKPQPGFANAFTRSRCILSKFHIKPQRWASY